MASSDESLPRIYRVTLSSKAYDDLSSIFSFIKTNSESDVIASNQVGIIEKAITELSIFPKGCPELHEAKCRIRHIKKYCILFDIDDTSSTVNVLRIFHSHQKYTEQFQSSD